MSTEYYVFVAGKLKHKYDTLQQAMLAALYKYACAGDDAGICVQVGLQSFPSNTTELLADVPKDLRPADNTCCWSFRQVDELQQCKDYVKWAARARAHTHEQTLQK